MPKKGLIPPALVAALAALVFVAACNDAPGPTAPPLPPEDVPAVAPDTAALVAGNPDGASSAGPDPGAVDQPLPFEMLARGGECDGKKVAICHLPPGNPDNIQEICISANAVPAHLAHGDYEPLTFWPDADGDGFGDASAAGESGCTVPPGFVEDNSDCDDADPAVNPAAEEICNGVDDDCNGEIDEGGVCVACPCWEESELLSVTAANQLPFNSCSTFDVPVIQNIPGSTPGVEGGFAAFSGRCLTRDFPPFSLAITAEEEQECADQIRSRCAAIGDPIPLTGVGATRSGTRGGFPGWE